MINTFYSLDTLGAPLAGFLSLVIGFGFGFALERAGFSSSRRLAGVFYFTDMSVVKVMFSALITALLGLSYMIGFGWIQLDQIFLMPSIYGAQIAGGLLFGVGFAMGAWCPGTAVAGLAAGKIDAFVFLAGVVGGSILFNEIYPIIHPLYIAGNQGVQLVYDTLGVPRNSFIFAFTLAAVAAFWFSEWAEKARTGHSQYLGSPFLKAFSLALAVIAGGLFMLNPADRAIATVADDKVLMQKVEQALDHIEPEELADRLMSGEPDLVVVDLRPAEEFNSFHIRGAINVPLTQLPVKLQPYKNKGLIAIYSNGMTHPAQARDSLQRQGFDNAYMLTDGLKGFRDRCLKPASLRAEPLTASDTARVNAWRAFFSVPAIAPEGAVHALALTPSVPRVVETDWLAARLGTPGLKVIDLRPQPEYNASHIPNALSLNVESLRGNIGGVPSILLPSPILSAQFSLLGLQPSDTVVLVSGDKLYDTTLAGMAFERLGQMNYAVMNGGYAKWAQENRPSNAALPAVIESKYPAKKGSDDFTADFRAVSAASGKPGNVIIDVRPPEFYTGKKSDEARAGHIPAAINRAFSEDVISSSGKTVTFKPTDVLASEYGRIIPSKDTEIIVHCRTGHQASQTFFVLKHLLGYPNVRWYDAGWTEWSARPELPVVNEANGEKGKQ
ncbi:MAG: rhodanese-like domain-containing protein [Victivallales bacterium]|jgi:thiosulfate/3-mercaptopyruvate sulfurtransferase